MDKFVCLGLIDISATFRDVWEPVPYDCNSNVSYIAVGEGILDVPKRYPYINLKFGQPYYPYNPIFPLDLPAAARR
ncbi:MAG: hypothetical protein ACI4HN_06630 [Ruminococcus sp.]